MLFNGGFCCPTFRNILCFLPNHLWGYRIWINQRISFGTSQLHKKQAVPNLSMWGNIFLGGSVKQHLMTQWVAVAMTKPPTRKKKPSDLEKASYLSFLSSKLWMAALSFRVIGLGPNLMQLYASEVNRVRITQQQNPMILCTNENSMRRRMNFHVRNFLSHCSLTGASAAFLKMPSNTWLALNDTSSTTIPIISAGPNRKHHP